MPRLPSFTYSLYLDRRDACPTTNTATGSKDSPGRAPQAISRTESRRAGDVDLQPFASSIIEADGGRTRNRPLSDKDLRQTIALNRENQGPSTTENLPTDLLAVVQAWATLPRAVKAGIVAMIKATGSASGPRRGRQPPPARRS